MIKITVKYVDEETPVVMEFKHSNIKNEQAVVDILNYPQPLGRYPYDLCDDSEIELHLDIEDECKAIKASIISDEDKKYLLNWVTYVYNQGVEDMLVGIVESMSIDDFKKFGIGWDNTDDGYVTIEVV